MKEDTIEDKKDKVKITRDRHNKTYFWCACNGHMVTLWWDDDEEYDFDLIELSFWRTPTARRWKTSGPTS